MRKSTIFSVLIVFCLVSFVGCATAPAAVGPSIPDLAAKQTLQQTQIDTLTTTKADTATVNALTTRVTTLEGQSAANTYPKTQLYTRAEIDKAIADAIEDLKDNGSSSNDDSDDDSDGEYGEKMDTDGALELWLEDLRPASDPFRLSSGVDEVEFEIVVVNNDDDETHRFDLSVRISPEDDVACAGAHIDEYPDVGDWLVSRSTPFNEQECKCVGEADSQYRLDCSGCPDPPSPPTVTRHYATEAAIYAENKSDIWIDKGDTDSYTIVFVVDSESSEYWDYKLWIEETH